MAQPIANFVQQNNPFAASNTNPYWKQLFPAAVQNAAQNYLLQPAIDLAKQYNPFAAATTAPPGFLSQAATTAAPGFLSQAASGIGSLFSGAAGYVTGALSSVWGAVGTTIGSVATFLASVPTWSFLAVPLAAGATYLLWYRYAQSSQAKTDRLSQNLYSKVATAQGEVARLYNLTLSSPQLQTIPEIIQTLPNYQQKLNGFIAILQKTHASAEPPMATEMLAETLAIQTNLETIFKKLVNPHPCHHHHFQPIHYFHSNNNPHIFNNNSHHLFNNHSSNHSNNSNLHTFNRPSNNKFHSLHNHLLNHLVHILYKITTGHNKIIINGTITHNQVSNTTLKMIIIYLHLKIILFNNKNTHLVFRF